ncbi:hypothetical protein WJX73_005001 [Symbiochloris irregularis]|uniref:Uncharacterized protein n=1 Tax=Symbiochloris irregularis TaxID=706552 RepID=A0AAW1PUH7_9CHLO
MPAFSEEQMGQFHHMLKPSFTAFSSQLEDIKSQQKEAWEQSFRSSIAAQWGRPFSKDFRIFSLQHLAKFACKSAGWPAGSDPVDVTRVAQKLATRLLTDRVAEGLLRSVWLGLSRTGAANRDQLTSLRARATLDPWFDENGGIATAALRRSLSELAFEDVLDDVARQQVRSKLERLLLLLEVSSEGGDGNLTHRGSAGVMLALFASNPAALNQNLASPTTYDELNERLPCLQLELDVRGTLKLVSDNVMIEAATMQRSLTQYQTAKVELQQRARLLQWVIGAALDGPHNFALAGHLFVPKSAGYAPGIDDCDGVNILTHWL